MDERMKSEITVLQEISSAIVHERNADALLNKVLDVLNRRMGMLRGTFTLLQGDTLTIEASQGLDENEKQLGRYHIGEGITGHVAETGRPHLIPDIRRDSRFLNRTKSRDSKEPVAFICVPIIHLEQVVGTLSIDRRIAPDTDLENDMALLEIIGNITAEAVSVAQKEHEERENLLEENRKLRRMLAENPGEMVGNCRAMQQVYELVRQVAPSDATVLIRGSSGTGKELVARAIVNLSPRREKPFVCLNCAALPENLVESELFGHEKGAFTGATGRRIGRAEAADGGTLFLDEIGDLSLQTQVKLLRFIQERTFSRVGSNAELRSNVRFLAATSRNLEELMSKKLFREDLYYRLNIFPISMPDLSKRKSDIILLAEHFIEKMNVKYGKKVSRLSTPAINMLMAYHWPGNVRELENCIERAVLTAQDECIHGYNLPPSLQTGKESGTELLPDGKASFNTLVDSYERELIVEALKRNSGNMSAAARDLGLSPRVIHYKIGRLGITPEWYVDGE
ncbi:GAF domain-containing protein [Victivallaceae bacterium BBE-744-WT-12]|uniref:GAF domain-containing protein n=1 Tax=Victivallis lenta TaxID=2606640 RepID=A0A844G2A2_9BACT|nr:sigma 54-interacting transcriptional regulator [Victivallis lenta]AVM46856.1 sigma-54-dependent Fis family transcriptional regulator [Victivallales bacterium CCUG 44730]MBS1455381.1 sigma 54-interacting transcriptional regulator [Lentisphaeria bacterium]MST97850.1 GAF domain-containing protein [Victivallis lenta]HBP07352.1 sigma-54-dependent Fis family transcriptional regulator [Lentisphaeria bacterium]